MQNYAYINKNQKRVDVSLLSNKINYSNNAIYDYAGKYVAEHFSMKHQRRTTKHFVLIYGIKETLYITDGVKNYEVGPNDYVILLANREHVGYKHSKQGLTYYWVHFLLDDYKLYFDDDDNECIVFGDNDAFNMPLYGKVTDEYKTLLLFQQLIDSFSTKNIFSRTCCQNFFNVILAELAESTYHLKKEKNRDTKINNILDWVELNCAVLKNVTEVSERFGYNSEYLTTLVKKETGLSLKEFINKSRVERAKQLLRSSLLNIREISSVCGFSDDKYFSRVFKKFVNMPPITYRLVSAKQSTNDK